MDSLQTKEHAKPFACPACSTRFTRQENLSRHTASVHRRSNLRPFPCPQCNVSFTRSDLRKRHVKKCHPEEGRLQSGTAPIVRSPTGLSDSAEVRPGSRVSRSKGSVGNVDQKNASSARPMNPFSVNNISWLFKLPQFISAYFERFQIIFPLLHQPSFDATSAQQPLLQAVACVGATYVPGQDHHAISLALFEAGLQSLDTHIQENPRCGFRETWVLQAYLIFEYFAIHSCEDSLFTKAIDIHRKLVDNARQYQLLQDSVMLGVGDMTMGSDTGSCTMSSPERDWHLAIRSESRKRVMYSLYYLDSQLSVCCNLRPILAALEIKFELPCRDDVWSAPTAEAWQALSITQDGSFNEGDDDEANCDPRPAHGDLYSSLMHLMNPRPLSRPLGLLWHSSFASLVLVIQIQMMVRDLILGSTFLYHNIRTDDPNHTLSIISESSRAQVMQALEALADLMPRINPQDIDSDPFPVDNSLWNHVWIAWHYSALCLTHQDGLLTNGIVEYSLPTAISTAWELGKPRSKQYRDVYEDRDVARVAKHLTQILALLTTPSLGATVGRQSPGAEDPFTTIIAFKSCLMGWRMVRLIAIGLQESSERQASLSLSSVNTAFGRSVMYDILSAMDPIGKAQPGEGHFAEHMRETTSNRLEILKDSEARYLERVEAAIARRDVWPAAAWIGAVFTETK